MNKKVVGLSVVGPEEGFRRGGRVFNRDKIEIPIDELTQAQIDAIKKEPKLVVSEVMGEVEVEANPVKAKGSAEKASEASKEGEESSADQAGGESAAPGDAAATQDKPKGKSKPAKPAAGEEGK